ncbi:MAG: ATP-binding cassette domain-containing protein [Hyphomonadaceae bacterium]
MFAITAFLLVSGYLRTLVRTSRTCRSGPADIEDVVGYASEQADVVDRLMRRFRPGRGASRSRKWEFGQERRSEPLYRDFSLEIAPGETVALVGPTGRASRPSLLVRAAPVRRAGRRVIRIDDQDVAGVTQASLRQSIAVVPQDPALFRPLAVGEHRLRQTGRVDGGDRRSGQTGACARLHRQAAGRLRHRGHERGVKLSGGERQRVALARLPLPMRRS